MKRCFFALICVSLLTTWAAAQPISEKNDLANFQGKWKLIGGTINGKKLSETEAVATAMTVIFQGDRLNTFFKGQPKGSFSFKVNTAKTPREIDTVDLDGPNKGLKTKGIYAIDEDILKICLRNKLNGRPSKFEVPEGVDDIYFLLRRDPPKAFAYRSSVVTRLLGFAVSPVIRAAVIEKQKK